MKQEDGGNVKQHDDKLNDWWKDDDWIFAWIQEPAPVEWAKAEKEQKDSKE